MKFVPLKIIGAYEIDVDPIEDKRGFFARTFCKREFEETQLVSEWVQMNISFTAKSGSLRGIHFQLYPHQEAKLIRAVHGKVFDVIVDLRPKSDTYGQHDVVFLEHQKYNSVYIPPGCGHGFQTLTDNVVMHYCHSSEYTPKSESGINALDPKLAIEWPLNVKNLSERDINLPQFSKLYQND